MSQMNEFDDTFINRYFRTIGASKKKMLAGEDHWEGDKYEIFYLNSTDTNSLKEKLEKSNFKDDINVIAEVDETYVMTGEPFYNKWPYLPENLKKRGDSFVPRQS